LELIVKELREKNKRKFKEYIHVPFLIQKFGRTNVKECKIKENVSLKDSMYTDYVNEFFSPAPNVGITHVLIMQLFY
jgi:hypothetical protein